MSKHTITADRTVRFQLPGMPDDERESTDVRMEIEYSYTAGSPGCRTLRDGDPGWPPDPAEIELISARLIDGGGLNPSHSQLNEWAIDWLDDEGYEAACENAAEDHESDRDNAREQAGRDRELKFDR